MVIVEFIKLAEFARRSRSIETNKGTEKPEDIVLYSLKFQLHFHLTLWTVAYGYCTTPEETLYDPPVFDIRIRVPCFTLIHVQYAQWEDLIKSPGKRRVLTKKKTPPQQKPKPRKGTDASKDKVLTKNLKAKDKAVKKSIKVFTAYSYAK